MADPPDSLGEDAPAQPTEEAPGTAASEALQQAVEVQESEDEPGTLLQELSLSEQPVEPQLSLQPVDQLQRPEQPSVQPEVSMNVPEPTEEGEMGREESVGGDGLVFGYNFLPPFANAENKALNSDIKEHEEKLESADVGLEEVMNRAQIMAEHLKSVQSELAYTQARVTSKRKEIQSEAHLKSLSERQLARYVADLKLIKKERDDLTEKVSSLQNQIYRANEKMDQFKILMNWSQEELEQWTMTQQQKEEDSEAIERYAAQDRAKIKELDLAITRMSRAVSGHNSDLQREVTDTQSVQMQLRKAADDFETLHKERQDLIKQWEDAVAQMRRTDAAIQAASELFADSKLELREKQRRLDIAAQFLDDQISNNKDCDDQIVSLERDLARLRTEFNSRQSDYQEVSEQVEIIKTMLSKSGNDHTRMQAENAALAKELDSKRLRLDDVRKKVANNRRKLEGEYVHLDTLAAKERELDNLANLESKRLEEVDKSLRMLEKIQFDKSQDLFKERQREKDLISEISGGQAQNRNLVRRIQQLDDNVIRQQELLYNVEFQLQKMERRVARAQGERSDEETAALNSRIKVLTVQLEGVNAQHTMLLGQVRKAEDDLEHANSARTRLTREREQVQSDLAALNLEADMVGRAVKKAASERQQKLVDLDVRKLEVQHLRESLNTKADEVFVLENRKLQLEQSLKERRHEISVHKQALEAELKLVKGDLHRVTQELQERRQRVQKLEAKFSVVSTKKKSMYEEEEPKSQAYYVIKAAQQRQELQATGDRLDGENHRLQKEVATLERTLEQMAASNQAYNKSFKPVNEKRAFAERSKLRERLDKVYDRLKFKRQEERNLMGDVWQAELRIQQLQHEQDTLQQVVQELGRHKEEALQSVQREEEKMAEAQGRLQHACESSGASDEELKCARLELMKGATQAMLSQLSRIADQFPTLDIKAALNVIGLGLEVGDISRPQSAASLAQGMGELEAAG